MSSRGRPPLELDQLSGAEREAGWARLALVCEMWLAMYGRVEMHDDVIEAAERAWLDLVRRAMREQWTDRESWVAAKATIGDLVARYGDAGVDTFSMLEGRIYRLFAHSPVADEVEREWRSQRRVAPG